MCTNLAVESSGTKLFRSVFFLTKAFRVRQRQGDNFFKSTLNKFFFSSPYTPFCGSVVTNTNQISFLIIYFSSSLLVCIVVCWGKGEIKMRQAGRKTREDDLVRLAACCNIMRRKQALDFFLVGKAFSWISRDERRIWIWKWK